MYEFDIDDVVVTLVPFGPHDCDPAGTVGIVTDKFTVIGHVKPTYLVALHDTHITVYAKGHQLALAEPAGCK